jgi:hypothetical protein
VWLRSWKFDPFHLPGHRFAVKQFRPNRLIVLPALRPFSRIESAEIALMRLYCHFSQSLMPSLFGKR